MFPTLAAVTLWSSLGFAGLVVFQAGVRLLTGTANDSIAKLGYMFALTTISIAVATAYMFGPESGPGIEIAAHMGVALPRTWAPLTLIIGLVAGFATLYMAVAPDEGDLGTTYKPVTLPSARAVPEDRPDTRSFQVPAAARAATRPLRPGGRAGTVPPASDSGVSPGNDRAPQDLPESIEQRSNDPTLPELIDSGPHRRNEQTHPTGRVAAAGNNPAGMAPLARNPTGRVFVVGDQPARSVLPTGTGSPVPRPTTGQLANLQRPVSGQMAVARRPATGPTPNVQRPVTGQVPAARHPTGPVPAVRRPTTGQVPVTGPTTTSGKLPVIGPATITGQVPIIEPTPTGQVPVVGRTKSGPIPPMPEHLRNRLSYLAVTAELTGGGIDARREDGTSRLVLWRDVVGVVVRRMPPAYDNATFVDVVSTARSTVRIVPWTRLTGDLVEGEGDARPRGVVEHVVAKCPGAKIDPATRQFLETGEAAQLPDLETLRAHDARLA
jgi:hypothetical protein